MTVLETIEKQTAREVLGAFDKYLHAIANDEGKATDEPKEAPTPPPYISEAFREAYGDTSKAITAVFRAFYAGYHYGEGGQ